MQVTIKVANNNNVLVPQPTSIPTIQTSAIGDLSRYSNTTFMLANVTAAYTNAVSDAVANVVSGLSANVAKLTSNNTLYFNGVSLSSINNVITSNGLTASAINQIILPATSTFLVKILVVARQTGGASGTAGDSAGWELSVLVKCGATAGSTAVVGGGGASISPTYSDAAAAAWRLSAIADTTNGGISVAGIGELNKNINWVARVISAENVG